MSKKPVTTTQRQKIATLVADNQSLSKMSRETGLHPTVCKRVAAEPLTLEMAERAGKLLAGQMQDLVQQIIDSVTPEDVHAASFLQRVTALGILSDKSRQAYGLDKPAQVAIQINCAAPVDLAKYQ